MFKPNSKGELICREMELTSIPKNLFADGEAIFTVDLQSNHLPTIEGTILFKLINLRILDLRTNHLEVLTEEIGYLWNLKELRLDNNHLTTLPIQLFQLSSLKVLTVTKNSLFALPDIIFKLRKLKTLSISNNQIKSIPPTILKLENLECLHLENNLFSVLPSGLFLMKLIDVTLEWFDYSSPTLNFATFSRYLDVQSIGPSMSFVDFLSVANKNHDYTDVLYRAIHRGDAGVISGLISGGVDLNGFDAEGYSPLMVAIKQDKFSICKMLISAGCSFKYGAGNYGSLLHIAVYKCEIWLVEAIVAANIDVNMIDAEGNTPLHILMGIFGKQKHKSKRIGELLIATVQNVNVFNHDNWAPLHLASRKGYYSALKWAFSKDELLKTTGRESFNVNIKGGSLDWVPLHLAAHSNNFKTVEILVQAGADVLIRNLEGKAAKDTSKGNVSIYKYLLRLELAQRKHLIHPATYEKLDFAPEVMGNASVPVTAPLYLRYQNLSSLYCQGKYVEISQIVSKDKDSIVAIDAIYLLSNPKAGIEFLRGFKGNRLAENERHEVVCKKKLENKESGQSIGPKVKQIQPSVICNQILAVEDE